MEYFITVPPSSHRKSSPSGILNTGFIFTPTLEPYLSLIWGFRPGQNNPPLNPPKSHSQRYFQMGASCFLKLHFFSLLTTENFRSRGFIENQYKEPRIVLGFLQGSPSFRQTFCSFFRDSLLPISKIDLYLHWDFVIFLEESKSIQFHLGRYQLLSEGPALFLHNNWENWEEYLYYAIKIWQK